MGLDWPEGIDRTPASEREAGNQFDVGFNRTKRQVRKEMERLGVDQWSLDDETGSGGDPGVVLRWVKDGTEYAVACDGYTYKRANLREVYLWVNETRMRQQRKARTAADAWAAAALPPGDPEREMVIGRPPPHEVLGVREDADPVAVRGAYRELIKEHSPDRGGNPERFKEIKWAKDQLLG